MMETARISWGWCDAAINALDLPVGDLPVRGLLKIEGLTPLSFATAQRGAYYYSLDRPSDSMLYGMLENMIGFHLDGDARGALFRRLGQKFDSNNKFLFQTVLRQHVCFTSMYAPQSVRFADVTVQMAAHEKASMVTGIRDCDLRIRPFMQGLFEKDVVLVESDKENPIKDPQAVLDYVPGTKGFYHVKFAVLPFLPKWYIQAPIKREYLIPDGAWRVAVRTTEAMSEVIRQCIGDPASAPYLGTNDGWVEVTWTT